MRKLLFLPLVLTLALTLGACSDSEDDDDGGGVLLASFTAGNASPGANSISLQRGTVNGASFTVNVTITDVTDLYGGSYTLTYSPQVLAWVGASEGAHLNSGGVGTSFQVALEGGVEGRLVVGHTRVGNVTGVSGSGIVHTLTFRGVAAGTTGLSFESLRLADSTGAVITGVTSHGGTATITQQ